jgi:quinol monooxygenase YgiN
MVIVAGTFEVAADQREAFLAGRIDRMLESRAEPGCLEYTFSADPIDPARVLLFERWASQEDLDAHLAAARARPAVPGAGVAPKAASIVVYTVASERSLGG